MGCPVPKVTRTGAGVALLSDPDRAVAVARAAREGSGLPVFVKLRAGRRTGQSEGFDLARRLADEAGVAAISFHPRSAQVRHKGRPDYELAAQLAAALPVPMILSGGMNDAAHIQRVFQDTGVAAVMLARGCLGNPWLFEQALGRREEEPDRTEILAELEWVVDRCIEHLGEPRASRYLKKFYPWYLDRLGESSATQDALQRADSIPAQREIVARLRVLQPA